MRNDLETASVNGARRRLIAPLLATAATLAMMVAQPAAAAVYVTTWTGKVATGYDGTGIFGPDHTVLNGKAFTATFRFDDGLPGSVSFNNSFISEIFGGRANGDPNNQLTGVLTIEGHSWDFTPAAGSLFLIRDGYPTVNNSSDEYEQIVQSALGDPGGQSRLNLDAFSKISSFLTGHDYRTPFTFTIPNPATLSGDFAIYVQQGGVGLPGAQADGILSPTTFSVALQTTSAAPEPAAWSLLILGVGGMGAALRTRRRTRTA